MKLTGAIILFLTGIVISLTAAFVSIYGMTALFAAHSTVVAIMIGSIELGKLVSAGWLKIYWTDKSVSFLHKFYLLLAVIVSMIITSLGIFGFLSAGHLEQTAPRANLEVQSSQFEVQLEQKTVENEQLQKRLALIDQNISVFLQKDEASKGLNASKSMQNERTQIQTKLEANNVIINDLNGKLAPLKIQSNDVEAKLGPVKYVAALFGWEDEAAAVRLIIVLIMITFDPLAVVLLISAMITFNQWREEHNPNDYTEIDSTTDTIDYETNANGSNVDENIEDGVIDESYTDSIEIEIDDEITEEPSIDIEEPLAKDDREILISILERNPFILDEIEEIIEENTPSDREKVLALLEKNPDIVKDMTEMIVSKTINNHDIKNPLTKKENNDSQSWLKD